MAMCERCWADAYSRSLANGKPQYDNYLALLEERKANPCPPAAARPAGEETETEHEYLPRDCGGACDVCGCGKRAPWHPTGEERDDG